MPLTSFNLNGLAHTANTAATARPISDVPGSAARSTLWFYNPTGTTVRVKTGESDMTVAGATSWPLPPGELQPCHIGSATHFSAWVASGSVGIEVFSGSDE